MKPIDLTCPRCEAAPGVRCVRPSGRMSRHLHSERSQLAIHALAVATGAAEKFAVEIRRERV